MLEEVEVQNDKASKGFCPGGGEARGVVCVLGRTSSSTRVIRAWRYSSMVIWKASISFRLTGTILKKKKFEIFSKKPI